MPIESARKFIHQTMVDQELRDQLNTAEGQEGRLHVLESAGFAFSPCEMSDAFRNELTKCQTEEAAAGLQELQQWWNLLQSL